MVLKYKYLNSKQGRRLDNLINTLVKKGKDDIKRRFNKIQCSSYSFRDKDVQAAHLRGISIHDVDIINCGSGGWKVSLNLTALQIIDITNFGGYM